MELNIQRLRRIRTGRQDQISFEIPRGYRDAVWQLVADNQEKSGDWFRVKLSPWRKRRSTGKGSQCNHFHGHCRQIAAQTGNDFEDIKRMLKWKAAREMGYPLERTSWVDGDGERHVEEAPQSESACNTVESGILIEAAHVFAAFEELELIEEDW